MGYPPTTDPDFQAKAARWISDRGEVLALFRYSHSAGSKAYEFFDSFEELRRRISKLPPRCCVIVFGERQLPLRGTVDEDLIHRALELIPDGTEFLVAGLELEHYETRSWYPNWAGENHSQLIEDLNDQLGRLVAVGRYPPLEKDSEEVISAVVPNEDGSVTVGVY